MDRPKWGHGNMRVDKRRVFKMGFHLDLPVFKDHNHTKKTEPSPKHQFCSLREPSVCSAHTVVSQTCGTVICDVIARNYDCLYNLLSA